MALSYWKGQDIRTHIQISSSKVTVKFKIDVTKGKALS